YEHSTRSPSKCPNDSGMPRCGQISRRAETPPSRSRQMSRGWPRSIWAFIRLGRTLRASKAGYQKPSNGALEGRVETESKSCMSMTDSEGRTFRIVDRVGSVKKSQPFGRRPRSMDAQESFSADRV